jgi:serine protease Do
LANNNRTLYEVLGVSRDAKATDIGRAYSRIKSEMQKETSAPNPRLAAMAKVAYETLSDPGRREEYDATLGSTVLAKRGTKGRSGTAMVVSVVALVAIAGAGYYFFARPPARVEREGEKALSPQEVVLAVAPHLARVQGALVSGEVRDLGIAVATGENEMVTTCRGMAAGMLLTVKGAELASKAELARANEELDICTLTVKGAGPGVKIRSGVPGSKEKIQAVLVNANGQPEARQVSVARAIKDAKGAALELKAAAPLPNGTPAFDAQGRLVGIVVTPHSFGEGLVVALGAARIAQARGGAASETVADAATPSSAAPASAATQTEPAAMPAGESTALPSMPPPRRGPRGSIVDQGFTTLWKEDRGGLIEVMDHPKVGAIGDPLAFWTLWNGRDVASKPETHCLVTFGDDEEVVADYDQMPGITSPDGYWYCALTRFQVDLEDLSPGEYHFTIFVDGQDVAEASTRIEKKFWTRGKYAIIVVVVGLALLFFVGKRKKPGE